MTEISRLPHPYSTNCTDYISKWRKQNGTGPLTELECIEHCKLNTLLSAGKCIDENVYYSHSSEHLCGFGIETITKDVIKECSSRCKPACLEQIYEMKYEEMEFNSRICNESDENCRTEFILLKISFRRFRLTKQIYEPKYTSIELFSYIGGFMGLWLGLSLVSFFDFLESLCLLTYFPLRRKSKKKL
ncbi:uncharacterized protein [Parasteatoda tepidariorum]|uniref:uncharacterized protein n=1 Tax=Parasteatoda tepidariorum TaxID=114398 RepID=UPI0039BC60C4